MSFNNVAYFSAMGPTLDGRIKPDIVAPGFDIVSSINVGGITGGAGGGGSTRRAAVQVWAGGGTHGAACTACCAAPAALWNVPMATRLVGEP